MDKKTITIVVIVVAVLVVISGAWYGINRWRQQRLANQILTQMYGVNTSLLGGLAGGNTAVQEQIAKELAKLDAQQKVDEAKEVAKTPEDKYNETKATVVIGEISSVSVSEIEPAIKAVFGKTKIIAYGTGVWSGQSGSFGANYKVPRVITGEDLNKLALEFRAKGYAVTSSGTESDSGSVTLSKGDEISLSFAYSNNGENQEIEVLYWNLATE